MCRFGNRRYAACGKDVLVGRGVGEASMEGIWFDRLTWAYAVLADRRGVWNGGVAASAFSGRFVVEVSFRRL